MPNYQYFTLAELVKSDVAKRKGIDNTPSFEAVEHLSELVGTILDPMRAAYGKAIRISSGYRCRALNKAVGGVADSAHTLGYAVDIQSGGSFVQFREFVVRWIMASGVKFDQVLLEKDKKTGARWIHIGLYNQLGQQRGQIKVLEV